MRTLLTTILTVFVLVALPACDSLVEDVDDPIDSADDELFSSADQVDFLIDGVEGRFASAHDRTAIFAGLLSDQFLFGGSGATFPTFRDLDDGIPTLDNNSVDGSLGQLGEYRFLADDLLRRIDEIDELSPEEGGWVDGEADPARIRTEFNANFHGAVARYFWATFYGDEPRRGGGVISEVESPADRETRGEFIPSEEMFTLAEERFEAALETADTYLGPGDGYDSRVIHTLLARIALFQGDTQAAATYAENGLEAGDAPFQAEYLDRTGAGANEWFNAGGPGRVQTIADFRFFDGEEYLAGDLESPEAARIPLEPVFDIVSGDTGYRQALYNERGSEKNFATWQENELILAEVELRNGEDATERVNAVRESRGLDPLSDVDLDVLFTERDKEFFTLGFRLVDQRRVTDEQIGGVDEDLHGWHQDENAWWYLPITLGERSDNPNIDE